MKYIIEFEDMPSFAEDGIAYYQCRQVPWWFAGDSLISRLTSAQDILSEIDKIDQKVDEAYERGLEDGKKEAESSEHIKSITADAFNKGMLFKEEKINDAFKRGFEKGKAVNDKGCEGCKYAGKVVTGPPCISCCNSYKNQWTAKSDKIEVGDEVLWDGEKHIVTRINRDVDLVEVKDYDLMSADGSAIDHVSKYAFIKTGKHFDIKGILEEMKK